MHWRIWLGITVWAACAGGCFNPDKNAPGSADTETDTDGTAGPSTMSMSASGGTGDPSTSASTTASTTSPSTTDAESGSGSTGDTVPDWGEGEPPDFGDLGPDGVANVLVVHALDFDGAVDVWLAGASAPIATGLAPEDAVLVEGIDREVHRVVLAQAGTFDAVGCSEWFPLRADEQWAVVSSDDPHTCPDDTASSITFEQQLELNDNPLRLAHAGAEDDLTVLRGGTSEPGVLEPRETLSVTDLPDCSSGCVLPYSLTNAGLGFTRDFSFLATEVADVPPPGEVLFVVLGDLREEWPNQPASLRLIRIDIDGSVRPMGRNPEVGLFAIFSGGDVLFSVLATPTMFPIGTAEECPFGSCEPPTVAFPPGAAELFASGSSGPQVSGEFNLEGGRRYLLVFTGFGTNTLTLVEDTLDRSDASIAVGLGFNVDSSGETLTIGRRFAGDVDIFDEFVDIDSLTTTGPQELPTPDWDLVYATGGATPGSDCFSGVDMVAGWRGLVSGGLLFELDAWPPRQTILPVACF